MEMQLVHRHYIRQIHARFYKEKEGKMPREEEAVATYMNAHSLSQSVR